MRSDDVVEHYSDLWLELVVLDSLVEHIDASDIDESFSWKEFRERAAAFRDRAAAMLPPSDAPPTEAELFARLDLTLADVRRANSAALESLGSADALGDDAAGGSSHGTSASGASTREAACAARPRTRIEEHVQEALRSIERAVGVPSDDECSLYGAQMNADTLIALKAMGIEPSFFPFPPLFLPPFPSFFPFPPLFLLSPFSSFSFPLLFPFPLLFMLLLHLMACAIVYVLAGPLADDDDDAPPSFAAAAGAAAAASTGSAPASKHLCLENPSAWRSGTSSQARRPTPWTTSSTFHPLSSSAVMGAVSIASSLPSS